MKKSADALHQHVMGLFRSEDQAAAAIRQLAQSPWKLRRVHSPVPSHKIAAALALKKSRVGLFTLAGGIIGFFSGFGLAIYASTQWHLIVGGKPVVALVPFVIVGFEFTILFAVFGNVLGFLTQTGLPTFKRLPHYDARCSGEHFGILAACRPEQHRELAEFFTRQGGEPRIFDAPSPTRGQAP